MSNPPTSHDVARAAGVSQAAVSYAMNGRGTLAPATRDRVLRVAEELGYRPNAAARAMRTRRSGRLAVVTGSALENQLELFVGAGEIAHAAGYVMETHAVEDSTECRTERVRDLVRSGECEGVLTLAPVLPEVLTGSTAREAAPEGDQVPVVAYAAFDEQMRSLGDLADSRALETFVRTLIAAGHRRFVHFAGNPQFVSGRERSAAYLAAIARAQQDPATSDVRSLGVLGGSWAAEDARELMHELPDDACPLAIIAGNDYLAAGVLRGAHERGWSVPGDIVVTGWDDAPMAAFFAPSLTTVSVNFREAGRVAMRRLVGAVRGEDVAVPEEPIHRIIWRESTGDAGAVATPEQQADGD